MALSYTRLTKSALAPDEFVCPLCLRLLPATCATLAHAPARQVGGKVAGLLCRACNSLIGRNYEAQAIGAARLAAGEQMVQVGPTGSEPRFFMRAQIEHDRERSWHGITLDPPGTGRKSDESMRRLRELGGLSAPTNLRLRGATSGASVGALLAWAYLLWFEHLGYSFAAQRSQHRLREALLGDDLDSLGRAPVGWQGGLPKRWERGRPVLVRIPAARAVGLGWEWPAVATVVLARAGDRDASVYDVLDNAVQEFDDAWEMTVRGYPVLETMRFGFPADAAPPPEGSPALVDGRVLLAGASREEALGERARALEPRARRPRAERRPREPSPPVPRLRAHVHRSSWPKVAVHEARRVAADQASISPAIAAAIGALSALEGVARDAAWRDLELQVDPGVATHLRDLWRHAVEGEPYDADGDEHVHPDNATFLVGGVPVIIAR